MNSSADPARRAAEQFPLTIDVEVPFDGESSRADYKAITFIACLLSFGAFLYYWHSGELLLFGDAVAHMNIARRVVDSRSPGLEQLGTVWLPLPHLLMIPFVVSTWMWKTGVGGAIPSMIAYVASVIGVFRLTRSAVRLLAGREDARVAAWFAALVYAANPNLLYLQATAMTEALYLALFIWATVFIAEFADRLSRGDNRGARSSLLWCGVMMCLGALVRYDGWFVEAIYGTTALLLLIAAARKGGVDFSYFLRDRAWRRTGLAVVLLIAVVPVGWFIYNDAVFGNPLAFANGPYSARGIEERTSKPGEPHHPGWHSLDVSSIYFMETAKLNMGATDRSERLWLYAALLGSILVLGYLRPLRFWLLLWTPLPFYAISIAWGSVPIFIPKWWPFSYYNVRYGIQLLPAFAVFSAVLLYAFMRKFTWRRVRLAVVVVAALAVALSYYGIWHSTPICLREARVNSVDRTAIEAKLAVEIEELPKGATLMMYLGEHGGALQQIGFPLRNTINEGNFRRWGSALWNPAMMADYVVATKGDPVAEAVAKNPAGLVKIAEIESPRQNPITVYRSVTKR